MPQPTSSDVHVDAVLTNVSTAYIQNTTNFVASQVFPVVPVEKQTDKYFTFDKNDFLRDEAQVRADGTESAGSGYGLSTASYSCDVFALHKDIGDQSRKNADNPLDLDSAATRWLTQRMLVRHEVEFASTAFTTGVWGAADVTPGTLWSTYATSDPLSDISTGMSTVQGNTGFEPNTFVVGYDVWTQLKNHPDVVDRIKYVSSESVTTTLLAQLIGVDRVLVAKGVYATNTEGATAAYANVMDPQDALLCYVAPTPSLMEPSAGYTFSWRGVSGGMGQDVGISRFRMPANKADRVEAEMAWDTKIVGSDLGYFFDEAVA
jgi:hypothetical protein